MPNKENLEKLKAVVEEKGIVGCHYYWNGSCCVIGHAVELMEQPILSNTLYKHNAEGIDSDRLSPVVAAIVEYYGIGYEDMFELQNLNDEGEDVVEFIDNLINGVENDAE